MGSYFSLNTCNVLPDDSHHISSWVSRGWTAFEHRERGKQQLTCFVL